MKKAYTATKDSGAVFGNENFLDVLDKENHDNPLHYIKNGTIQSTVI